MIKTIVKFNNRIYVLFFDKKDIKIQIIALGIKKVHGHDGIVIA